MVGFFEIFAGQSCGRKSFAGIGLQQKTRRSRYDAVVANVATNINTVEQVSVILHGMLGL